MTFYLFPPVQCQITATSMLNILMVYLNQVYLKECETCLFSLLLKVPKVQLVIIIYEGYSGLCAPPTITTVQFMCTTATWRFN